MNLNKVKGMHIIYNPLLVKLVKPAAYIFLSKSGKTLKRLPALHAAHAYVVCSCIFTKIWSTDVVTALLFKS